MSASMEEQKEGGAEVQGGCGRQRQAELRGTCRGGMRAVMGGWG